MQQTDDCTRIGPKPAQQDPRYRAPREVGLAKTGAQKRRAIEIGSQIRITGAAAGASVYIEGDLSFAGKKHVDMCFTKADSGRASEMSR